MATGAPRSALPYVEQLFQEGTVAGLSEGSLLERFLLRGDEVAFEALVARHGPLVLGVCRRLLRDPSDVEDAFQATFLVLVRKARSIRDRELLGPWLYGVAYRVALRSRIARSRRKERESVLSGQEADSGEQEPGWRELRPVIDEEVARLPERYRAAVVLCYLQGLTHHEAAGRLGCPVGTVRSRLSRGRERLRMRLERRGLAPAVALVGSSLATEAMASPTPSAMMIATVKAVSQVAVGGVGTKVASLSKGVLGTMKWRFLGIVTAGLLVVSFIGAGAFYAGLRKGELTEFTSLYEINAATSVTRPELKSFPAYVVQPPDLIIVEVLDALPGRPISGERLVRPDGTISLGFYGDLDVAGLTLDQIKERVILRLRSYVQDETLGLWKYCADCDESEPSKGQERQENLTPKGVASSPAPPLPPRDDPNFTLFQECFRAIPMETPPVPDEELVPYREEARAKPPADNEVVEVLPLPDMPAKEEPPERKKGRWVVVAPRASDAVFVDVAFYNSKFYYVLGEFATVGKFPCTGRETVLDAIQAGGGVLWSAAPERMRLIRSAHGNQPDQVLPVDYAAISHGTDPSTNYQLFPGDRLVVPSNPKRLAAAAHSSGDRGPATLDLQRKIDQLEKKLDEMIRAMKNADRKKPAESEPEKRKLGSSKVTIHFAPPATHEIPELGSPALIE